ncbi:MAG: hypothetical protein HY791_15515 [Deltaproteobacteria bacterium]|nr:hypothetical protein [Deltaproteobacteria bacterium]
MPRVRSANPPPPQLPVVAPRQEIPKTGLREIDAQLSAPNPNAALVGAAKRILGKHVDPAADVVGRGQARRIPLGQLDGSSIEISPSGRFSLGGKVAAEGAGVGADALLVYKIAERSNEDGNLFAAAKLSQAMRGRVFAQLSEGLEHAQAGKSNAVKDKLFSGSIALLLDLADACPKSDATLRAKILDRVLGALAHERDPEPVAFYANAMRTMVKGMDAEQKAAYDAIVDRVLPGQPPVEAWTAGRTKPLEVRHSIHPEFWKEELAFFSKKNGFTLISKNAKDDHRTYQGKILDPTGKKAPLLIELEVKKEELDFLEPMPDPKAFVILYSGHSSVGGNGSQSIQAAGTSKGGLPKLVLAANCRGKDNYAEFTNKYPKDHAIMTEHPTYSVSGQARISALFEMLARGETYAWMREKSEVSAWDEPSNNYFYPDEWRKFRFMDVDEDGKIDAGSLGTDRLYDVDARAASRSFVRSLNFSNSELFYHWEVDAENKKKSHFGKEYSDSLIPAGRIKDPKPGEVVRVRKVSSPKAKQLRFEVKFAIGPAKKLDQNLYAGVATMETIKALSIDRDGGLSKQEALRAVLMGAQAIHYLDVYIDTAPKTTKAYFDRIGLVENIDDKKIEHLFEKFDAHANDEQVAAFEKLLTKEYGVDLDAWYEKFGKGEIQVA